MAILSQGSKVYFLDPETKKVVAVNCATAFTPGGAPSDQIETTCLEDNTRTYLPGLRTPGQASLTVNFDPQDPSHVRMYELSQQDPAPTLDWAMGWSDGTVEPTPNASGDALDLPAGRTWYTFQGYLADVPFDVSANTVVTSAASIQRSGVGVLVPRDSGGSSGGGNGGSGSTSRKGEFPVRTTNRLYGTAGDSRLGLSLYAGGALNRFLKSMGLCHWIDSFSGGRAMLNIDAHTAIAGSDTNQMVARLEDDVAKLKASGVKVVFFIGGTNDYTSSIAPATTRANIQTVVKRLTDEGFTVVTLAETPRRASDTEEVKNAHYLLHRWLVEDLATSYFVIDQWDDLCDPIDRRIMVDEPGVTYDNQHGAPTWQQRFGRAIWHGVEHLFPRASILPVGNDNETVTPNALFAGTAGRIDTRSVSASGSVATGWTLEGDTATGLTVVMSKGSHPEYGATQIMRITGTAAEGNELKLYCEPSVAQALGTKLKGVGEIQWRGQNLVTASLNLLAFPSYTSKIDGDAYSLTTLQPTQHIGSRETPVALLEDQYATSCRLYYSIRVLAGVEVDITLVMSRAGLLKV